jgi:hypothetical protein
MKDLIYFSTVSIVLTVFFTFLIPQLILVISKAMRYHRLGRELLVRDYVKCEVWKARHPRRVAKTVACLEEGEDITILPADVACELELSQEDKSELTVSLRSGEKVTTYELVIRLDDDKSLNTIAAVSSDVKVILLGKDIRRKFRIKEVKQGRDLGETWTRHLYS